MSEVKLIKKEGCFCIPESEMTKAALGSFGDGPVMLIRRYDAGDCDAIESVKGEKNKMNLRYALYDAREMGLIPYVRYVLLPSGAKFEIDF